MTMIRYTRSAATVSWIDAATGLPEFDLVAPGAQVSKAFLTGNTGFRFVNFMEVWAIYDSQRNTIVGHGFTPASGIYRSLSFGGIPSRVFSPIRRVRVGREPISFTQIIGARTESPEKIGGMIFGPAGNIAASAITGFPPIWSEISIKIHNDGYTEVALLRHSLFPSLTFYTRPVNASGEENERGNYKRTALAGSPYYNAMPHLGRWQRLGWGAMNPNGSGPTLGNPWGFEQTIFTGIDATQPFGW